MVARVEYYLGAQTDSPFYGDARPQGRAGRGATTRLQTLDVPAGWLVQSWSGWEGWTPRDWTPRLQGWKIHVSATPACAQETLARTSRICLEREVAFKFLPTLAELHQSSSKQVDRGGSGKFITIYPADDEQLADLLIVLDRALTGQDGPYVLSDLRFADTPVFVRYGGIMAMSYPDDQDRPVSAVAQGDSLTLVPDQRQPRFSVPAGVLIPEVLQEAYQRSQQSSTSRLNEFDAISPLHFSNAGGVYKATLPDGTVRVLREARPHAGLDGRDRGAVQRQQVEQRVLEDLRGVPGVQQLIGAFSAWEHRYLELEYLPGITLTAWVVRNITQQQDEPELYARRCVRIAEQIIGIVERIHECGWSVGDLHTGNLLVSEEDEVAILDLEDAAPLDEPRQIGFRVFEFCATEDLSAREADWFAVARCLMMMYVADWEIEGVAPDYWRVALERVRRVYGAAAHEQLLRVGERYPGGARSLLAADDHVGVFAHTPAARVAVGQLRDGIAWSRRYSEHSSYPGDVGQPDRHAHEVLGSGRAGVVFTGLSIDGQVEAADLTALTTVAEGWDGAQQPGLYDGLAGLALVLAEAGRHDVAVSAARRALESAIGRRRLDLWGGQAGVLLAAIEVAGIAGDRQLLEEALAIYERLHAAVLAGGSARDSLTRRRGYFWGLTGLALTDLAAHLATGSPQLLARAAERVRQDLDACVTIATGELMVRDEQNNRVLPYVEWGSAGIWLVATAIEAVTGQPLLTDQELDGVALACSGDFYIYPTLDHGRAGILVTLTAGGERFREEAERQSKMLRESLLHRDGMAFVIGEGLVRLSSDLSTGAAGVALGLHAHLREQPYLILPVSRRTARSLGQRPRPVRAAGDDLSPEQLLVRGR